MASSTDVDVSRNAEYLRLPPDCVRECGLREAITFAAFYRYAGKKSNFTCVRKIAELTGTAMRTTERHLAKLERLGWIDNHGRKGTGRRTATRQVSSLGRVSDEWELVLPLYSLTLNLKPASLALLAVSFHRTRGITNAVNGCNDNLHTGVWMDDEFQFSVKGLSERLGMSANSIRAGYQQLREMGLIDPAEIEPGKVCLVPRLGDHLENEDDAYLVTEEQKQQVKGGGRVAQMWRAGRADLAGAYIEKTSYRKDNLSKCSFQPPALSEWNPLREQTASEDNPQRRRQWSRAAAG